MCHNATSQNENSHHYTIAQLVFFWEIRKKRIFFLFVSKIILIFAHVFTSEVEAESRSGRGGDTYMEKVSTWRFVLWLAKLSRKQVMSLSETKQRWMPSGYVNRQPSVYPYSNKGMRERMYSIFSCGLLRCSTLRDGQCETPKRVGRATGTATHTFCLYVPITKPKIQSPF